MINSCLFCDKQFETDDENMLFCSKECKEGFREWQTVNLGEQGFEPFEDCTCYHQKKEKRK